MPIEINATHDPARRSFVASANVVDSDFPIQNLPFGVFDDGKGARGGVALGDQIVDLTALLAIGTLDGVAAEVHRAADAALGQRLQVEHGLRRAGIAPAEFRRIGRHHPAVVEQRGLPLPRPLRNDHDAAHRQLLHEGRWRVT